MSTITANLTSSRSVTGSFAQSSQPQVVRVTVPGPQGPTGSSASTLQTLSDVDVSTLLTSVSTFGTKSHLSNEFVFLFNVISTSAAPSI